MAKGITSQMKRSTKKSAKHLDREVSQVLAKADSRTRIDSAARELAADRIHSMARAELIALLSSVEHEEGVGAWVRADAVLVTAADVKKSQHSGATSARTTRMIR